MSKKHIWAVAGYVAGSFFGLGSLLKLVRGR